MKSVRLERMCLPVTLRCNLHCKLCAERSPYYKNPYHPSYDDLAQQIEGLFQLVDYIGIFDITGGEPFIRKDLPDIIRYMFHNYRHKIGRLRVITNGTLLPPEGFTEAAGLWEQNFYTIVDHYSISEKCEEIGESLRMEDIPFEIRNYSNDLHCDGWVDYGDLSYKHSFEEAKELYHSCAVPKLGFFTCMVNGTIFPCARARLLYENGIASVCMNIFDTELSENGKKARLIALLGEEAIDACKFCNGLCENSPRYFPAEQLKELPAPNKVTELRWWQHKVYVYTRTYNNENTIARCIESVLSQTYKNFTYFLIDNASTDATGNIIEKYAEKDNRIVSIKVDINDLNSINKIQGIANSKTNDIYGEYYCFLDGDDTYEPDWLERAVTMADANHADIIIGGHRKLDAATGEEIFSRSMDADRVVSFKEIIRDFMTYRPHLLPIWGRLFSKKYMRNLSTKGYSRKFSVKYPEQFEQFDGITMINMCEPSQKIGFLKGIYYNYYYYNNSWINTYSPTKLYSNISVYYYYKDLMKRYQVFSETNQKYLYVIFFSFIEMSLDLIYKSDITFERKLYDISTIFRCRITEELMSAPPDTRFRNLEKRKQLIANVKKWILSRQDCQYFKEMIKDLIDEIDAVAKLIPDGKGYNINE